jgi:hypothetical protein
VRKLPDRNKNCVITILLYYYAVRTPWSAPPPDPPPPPPPPATLQPAGASQFAPIRILRRSSGSRSPSCAEACPRSQWEDFFLDSPPPPPAHGRPPPPLNGDCVPETPDPRAPEADPRLPPLILRAGVAGPAGRKASFAEVVRRGGVNAPRQSAAPPRYVNSCRGRADGSRLGPRPLLQTRRIYSGEDSRKRSIWVRRQGAPRPSVASSDPSDQGWSTTSKRRRHSSRRCDGSDRRRSDNSWRPGCGELRRPPNPGLEGFIRASSGRCFNCLARDHRAASCRDPVKSFRCLRSGH